MGKNYSLNYDVVKSIYVKTVKLWFQTFYCFCSMVLCKFNAVYSKLFDLLDQDGDGNIDVTEFTDNANSELNKFIAFINSKFTNLFPLCHD